MAKIDDLIDKYAEILKAAKPGDFTYHAILAKFAREVKDSESLSEPASLPTNGPGSNNGHGHVWQRPDGLKVRCGGASFCPNCKKDQELYG